MWNPRDNNQIATALDHTVKMWDFRKFETGSEIMSKDLDSSNLRNITFDPEFGKLLVA